MSKMKKGLRESRGQGGGKNNTPQEVFMLTFHSGDRQQGLDRPLLDLGYYPSKSHQKSDSKWLERVLKRCLKS